MIEKICKKCGERLPLSMFHKHKGMTDGHRIQCRTCRKENGKEYREKNKDKIKEYREKNKDKRNKQNKEWCEKNKDKRKEYRKEYNEKNKEKNKKQSKEWREKNKDKVKKYNKEYNDNNKDKRKEWKEKNKEKRKKQSKENLQRPSKFLRKRVVALQRYQRNPITGELGTRRATDDETLLEVRCKQCSKWFKPTNSQVRSRIDAIKGEKGGVGVECHLYCSDSCKNSCSIFYQKDHLKGFNTKPTREVDQFTIELCLERDNYECQRCLHEMDLEVHHIKGAAKEPLLANDIDNVITLCSDCHKKVHAEEGCHYSDYKRPKCNPKRKGNTI